MTSQSDNSGAILAGPPSISPENLANAVARQFGLVGDYTELVSERDRNYRLTAENGHIYVVKATCLAEDVLVTDFQIAALIHMENRGLSGIPRIVRTTSGRDRGVIRRRDGLNSGRHQHLRVSITFSATHPRLCSAASCCAPRKESLFDRSARPPRIRVQSGEIPIWALHGPAQPRRARREFRSCRCALRHAGARVAGHDPDGLRFARSALAAGTCVRRPVRS